MADEDDLDRGQTDHVGDEDGWDDAQVDEWVEAVQAEVAYCGTCQPYDDGECVWIFGEQVEWDDIFDMYEVPEDEELRAQIARQIECPRCGAGLDDTCSVGVKSKREKSVDELWATWEEEYGWRFEQFYALLEKHPYLGLSDGLGAELRDHIGKLPRSKLQEQVWYRARPVSSSDLLSARDLLPPDVMKVAISEGRYNHFGQRVFYLAEAKEAAAREVLGDAGGLAWVQAFRFPQGISDVLDLAPHDHEEDYDEGLGALTFGLIFTGTLREEVKRTGGWKPEYFVPRFIADCARASGFCGIRFRSPRHYGRNLVLFSWSDDDLIPEGEPSIVKLSTTKGEEFLAPPAAAGG